jgi:sterol 3beta-glucosyltransferase
MVDGSEEGRHEEGETARKFRSVFSLPDREELIDRELARLG